MLQCSDFRRLLSGFVAGELPPERRGEAEHHLARCADCRSEHRLYEQTIQLARALPPVPLPKGLLERFKGALKNDLSSPNPGQD